jgi:hypothetical protein
VRWQVEGGRGGVSDGRPVGMVNSIPAMHKPVASHRNSRPFVTIFTADLPNLVALGGATLRAVFSRVRQQSHTEKAFYIFLWKCEERFSEAQQAYADETFALLAQYRQNIAQNRHNTRAETGCRASSSNDPQRDRSRSVRRRTASGTLTNSGAPQPAPLKRRRCSSKRPALICDDVPSAETAQSIHSFGSGSAHSAAVSLPPLDASIIEEVQKLGRHPLEISVWVGKELTPEERDERSLARKIRKNFSKLLSDTVSYLSRLKLRDVAVKHLREVR